MKIHYIGTLCLAALLATGCSDQLVNNPLPEGEESQGHTVRIGAVLGEKGTTRLGYKETDTEMNLYWTEGDQLVVYTDNDTVPTLFELKEGVGTASAIFEAANASFEEGEFLYALYCKGNQPEMDADGNLTLSVEGQDGTLNDKYQMMFGTATYMADGTPRFLLEHLTSLMKVNIQTESTLQSITLAGGNLNGKATMVLKNRPSDFPENRDIQRGDIVFPSGGSDRYGEYSRSGLTIQGSFAPVDGVVSVYFYMLPARVYGSNWANSNYSLEPSIQAVTTDSIQMVSLKSFSNRNAEAGKMYELTSPMFTLAPFRNEGTADCTLGEALELWTEDDLYTLMLHCKNDDRNAQNKDYRSCNYKLMADIVLTDKLTWTPIRFYGTLDGNGKSIGGSITTNYSGGVLVDYANNALFKNLILDFTSIQCPSSYTGHSGIICGNPYGSTFEHCINRSAFTGHATKFGALVGKAESCTFVACGNEGTLTPYESNTETIGGLVGEMGSRCTMEACYNTGVIHEGTVEGFTRCGLIGLISGNTNTLNSCWSAYGLSLDGFSNSYPVESAPDAEQIAAMNATMQNSTWIFKADGRPGKDSSSSGSGGSSGSSGSSVPDIPAEEW